MKALLTILFISASAFAADVQLNQCKVELQRFHPIACAGGGPLNPKICSGSMKCVGPLTVSLMFDPASGKGNGTGKLYTTSLKLSEDFNLNCAFAENKPGYIDCVSDIGLLGISDKKLYLRTRAQSLKDGSYFFWVGAPDEMKWFATFQSSKSCNN